MPVYVTAGWIWALDAGRGIVENNDCGVGGVVNDDEVDSENVGDGVRELGGGESSAGLWTAFVIGSKRRTRLPCGIGSERLLDSGAVVVVVVVRVKGAIRVVSLGGTVLYIFAGPVGRLTPLKTDVYPRLRLHPVDSRGYLKACPDDRKRPWR